MHVGRKVQRHNIQDGAHNPSGKTGAGSAHACMALLARMADQKSKEGCNKLFMLLDRNGDGSTDAAEILATLEGPLGLRLAPGESDVLRDRIAYLDANQNGSISITEFMSRLQGTGLAGEHWGELERHQAAGQGPVLGTEPPFMKRIHHRLSEKYKNCNHFFILQDKDKSGLLTADELRSLLCEESLGLSPMEAEEAAQHYCKGGRGLSYHQVSESLFPASFAPACFPRGPNQGMREKERPKHLNLSNFEPPISTSNIQGKTRFGLTPHLDTFSMVVPSQDCSAFAATTDRLASWGNRDMAGFLVEDEQARLKSQTHRRHRNGALNEQRVSQRYSEFDAKKEEKKQRTADSQQLWLKRHVDMCASLLPARQAGRSTDPWTQLREMEGEVVVHGYHHKRGNAQGGEVRFLRTNFQLTHPSSSHQKARQRAEAH